MSIDLPEFLTPEIWPAIMSYISAIDLTPDTSTE